MLFDYDPSQNWAYKPIFTVICKKVENGTGLFYFFNASIYINLTLDPGLIQ